MHLKDVVKHMTMLWVQHGADILQNQEVPNVAEQ